MRIAWIVYRDDADIPEFWETEPHSWVQGTVVKIVYAEIEE